MLKSVLAVIAGFLTTVVLAFTTDFAITVLAPSRLESSSVQLLIATLVYTELYATAGGYVTGRLARAITPVYILAAIAFLLTAAVLLLGPSIVPAWYKAISLLLLVPATWLGGWFATAQSRNLLIDKRQSLQL